MKITEDTRPDVDTRADVPTATKATRRAARRRGTWDAYADYSAICSGVSHALARRLSLDVFMQANANPHVSYADPGCPVLVVPYPPSMEPDDLQAWHGMIDHECAHLLFTDPKALDVFKGEDEEGNETYDHRGSFCLNVVEDPRVNLHVSRAYLGCGDNLRALYEWSERNALKRAEEQGQPLTIDTHVGALVAGSHYALMPERVGDSSKYLASDELRETFDKAHDLCQESAKEWMESTDTLDGIPLALELAKLIPDDEIKKLPRQQSASADRGREGKEGTTPENEESEEASPDDGGAVGHGFSPFNADDDLKNTDHPMASAGGSGAPWEGVYVPGVSTLDAKNHPKLELGRKGEQVLALMAAQGRKLAADVRRALIAETQRGRVRRQRAGRRLDGGSLPDIATRTPDPRPWQRRGSVTPGHDTHVCIVVDGSGSMGGVATAGGHTVTRTTVAAGAAAALAQGMALIPGVSLDVTCNYTTEYDTVGGDSLYSCRLAPWLINQRYKPGMERNWARTRPEGGTETWGANVRWAVGHMTGKRVARKVVVLITDGALTGPDVPQHAYDNKSDLTDAYHEAARQGVEVYGIAWGPDADWMGALPARVCEKSEDEAPSREWLAECLHMIRKGAK